MEKPQDYIANADGWIAGKWRAKGTPLQMTAHAAKYEQVTLASDAGPKVELTGALDDPLVKSTGLAAKAQAETKKRTRK